MIVNNNFSSFLINNSSCYCILNKKRIEKEVIDICPSVNIHLILIPFFYFFLVISYFHMKYH